MTEYCASYEDAFAITELNLIAAPATFGLSNKPRPDEEVPPRAEFQ
jgi:hypothetical protein